MHCCRDLGLTMICNLLCPHSWELSAACPGNPTMHPLLVHSVHGDEAGSILISRGTCFSYPLDGSTGHQHLQPPQSGKMLLTVQVRGQAGLGHQKSRPEPSGREGRALVAPGLVLAWTCPQGLCESVLESFLLAPRAPLHAPFDLRVPSGSLFNFCSCLLHCAL